MESGLAALAVSSKLAAAAVLNANATHTLEFTEALDSASLQAVKAAVDAAYSKVGTTSSFTSVWSADNKTLTVTIEPSVGNEVTLSTVANQTVKDLAGNVSTALVLQQ